MSDSTVVRSQLVVPEPAVTMSSEMSSKIARFMALATDPIEALSAFFQKHQQLGFEFYANVATLIAAGFSFAQPGARDTLRLVDPNGRILSSLSWASRFPEVMAPLNERVIPFISKVFEEAPLYPRSLWDTFLALKGSLDGANGPGILASSGLTSTAPQLFGLALAGLIASRAFHELDPKQQAEILLARAQILGEQARSKLAAPISEMVKGVGYKGNDYNRISSMLSQAIQYLRDASQLDSSNLEIRQLLADLRTLADQRLPKASSSQLA